MKTKNYYLILAVVTGILCAPALGKIELSELDVTLLGQVNPALAGLEQLYVVILPPDAEPNKDGLVREELKAKVVQRIVRAGIKIYSGPIRGSLNHLNVPLLRVYIDMLKLPNSQQYVFHIHTSLAKKVYLAKDYSRSIKANVWKVPPVMQAASVENMPARVTDVVLEQVEAFITAYLVTNPKAGEPADVNDIVTHAPKQAKPAAKPIVAEHKYVASKNSKVFHKPECSSAKRIKPKNLIGYNSRDEAINAGKRPCKRCKP